MSRRSYDVDALLRAPVEPLPPPPGAWLEIRRRARRLRTARRATAVVAAAAAVAVIAVPVLLVLHGTPSPATAAGTRSQAGHLPTSAGHDWAGSTATTYSSWSPPASLRGLQPLSLSFGGPQVGYLLGRVGGQVRLAQTVDGGESWVPLPVPSGYSLGSAGGLLGGVRFATERIGFLFGSTGWMTQDGGRDWRRLAWSHPITDIEVAGGSHGRLWALARQCPQACGTERLYTAPVASPRLQPVLDVPALPDPSAQLSLTSQGQGVFVLANRPGGEPVRYWSTNGGRSWSGDTGPCIHRGAIAALIPNEAAVLCSAPGRRGDRRRDYVVLDHLSRSKDHQRSDFAAPPVGDLVGLTANNSGAVVLAEDFSGTARSDAPFQVSTDSGRSWQASGPHLPGGAGFVGFISPVRVVGLSAAAGHAFLASDDGGLSWRVTSFAG